MSERGKPVPKDVISASVPHRCEDSKFHNAIQVFVAAANLEATVRASLGEDIQHYADVVAEQFPQLQIIPRGVRRSRKSTAPKKSTE